MFPESFRSLAQKFKERQIFGDFLKFLEKWPQKVCGLYQKLFTNITITSILKKLFFNSFKTGVQFVLRASIQDSMLFLVKKMLDFPMPLKSTL